MELVSTLTFCIAASFLFTAVAKRLRISVVVGLITVGIFLGSSSVKETILEPNTGSIMYLGDIGLIFLMFLAGLEVSWSMLYRERKDAAIVALFASVTPFLLGFLIFLELGFEPLVALTIGICMSVTAEATKARELLELGKLKTKLGSLMLGAGIIDDIIAMTLFVIVAYWFEGTFLMREYILLLSAIIAFFVGVFVHSYIGRKEYIIPHLEQLLMIFIIPFFFITIGIHFNLTLLTLSPILLVLIIGIALLGKIAGVLLTKPFTKLRLKQLYLIGWGMNSRGAVELAIVFVAFDLGILNTEIFSALVFMALVTTLVFPFIIRNMIKRNPRIMG